MPLWRSWLFQGSPSGRSGVEMIANAPDLQAYDRFLVAFSGGKDSICCLLHLLEAGVNPDKIELHHHLVDGREGSTLFDWPCTEDYCRLAGSNLVRQHNCYCGPFS